MIALEPLLNNLRAHARSVLSCLYFAAKSWFLDEENEWIFIYRNVKFRNRAIMCVYQALV